MKTTKQDLVIAYYIDPDTLPPDPGCKDCGGTGARQHRENLDQDGNLESIEARECLCRFSRWWREGMKRAESVKMGRIR
jgi:hypothetical protein